VAIESLRADGRSRRPWRMTVCKTARNLLTVIMRLAQVCKPDSLNLLKAWRRGTGFSADPVKGKATTREPVPAPNDRSVTILIRRFPAGALDPPMSGDTRPAT
jgi:hypothetical protein